MFLILLTSIVHASNHTKYMLLSNQKCMIQPNLINLNPTECSQEFHYYPFEIKLDRCVGSCNTLKDLSKKVCVPSIINMITGIKESKILTKDIP